MCHLMVNLKQDPFNFDTSSMTIKKSSQHAKKDELVRMNFDLPEELRKAFKAKLAKEGKTSREVIVGFIKEYLKK